MVENTTKRDTQEHALGAMVDPDYVENMEAAGGRQLVADSELMPAEGPWGELVRLGFGEPEKTDDPLFVRTKLPPGWSKRSLDDPRGSEVLDERGLPRVGVFYKAAYYDRKADCHLIRVGFIVAIREIYAEPGDPEYRPPGLPPKWDVMTKRERREYTAELYDYLENAREHPSVYGDRVPRVRALLGAVKRWRKARKAQAGCAG